MVLTNVKWDTFTSISPRMRQKELRIETEFSEKFICMMESESIEWFLILEWKQDYHIWINNSLTFIIR